MYNDLHAERFLPPVPLGGGAYVAISEQRHADRGIGLAFVVDGSDIALMGIPAANPEAVMAAFQTIGPAARLRRIVVLEWDDRLIETLNRYARFSPDAVVVADRRVARSIQNDIPLQIFAIHGANDTVVMPSGRVIGFVPSPFVFTPSAIMAFDYRSHTLFSNRLFETSWDSPLPATIAETIPAMLEYHRQYAPSSEYLRPVLAAVAKLDLACAVTRTGTVYPHDALFRLIGELSATEFFNSPRSVGRPSETREYSHAALSTQVLFKLVQAYGEPAVLETFADTEITVTPNTLEIAGLPDDYRVWQRLFDVIFVKRGPAWLAVVEPLVDKLVGLYGIAKPAVYQSVIAQVTKDATRIDAEKKELESRIQELEDRLSGTLDKLTRDPMTGMYNERFLREFVAGLSDKRASADDAVLLYVAIDDITRINVRYSNATGDETIKNLGYLLDRIRRPQDLVFKRTGPAYVVCLSEGGRAAALETLRKVKEGVRDAEAFIESLSVSAGLVRLAEIPKDAQGEKLADAMFALGDARIRFALESGPSAFVDETTKIATVRAGRILLVDDDPTALSLLAALLRADNYEVVTAEDGLSALSAGKTKPFDVILCERNVPKLDGFGLRHDLYAGGGTTPRLFILMTYAKTRETVVRANQAEIDYVVEKPVIYEELGGLIRRALRKAGMSR